MTITKVLKAQKRDGSGKGAARKLRGAGRVPAVLYGGGMEPVSLSIDAMEAGHLFQAISVENTIVELDIEGEKGAQQTLVREVQTHAHRMELIHVDFLRIQKGVAIELEIPVHLVGTPVGVKLHGGIVEQIIHELPVECIPSLIPEMLEVDVSALDVDDSLHVKDIPLPEGVEAMIDAERTVCVVAVPRAAAAAEGEEIEEEVAEEAAEPEIVGEKAEESED